VHVGDRASVAWGAVERVVAWGAVGRVVAWGAEERGAGGVGLAYLLFFFFHIEVSRGAYEGPTSGHIRVPDVRALATPFFLNAPTSNEALKFVELEFGRGFNSISFVCYSSIRSVISVVRFDRHIDIKLDLHPSSVQSCGLY
jgi:hypothetical protein